MLTNPSPWSRSWVRDLIIPAVALAVLLVWQ